MYLPADDSYLEMGVKKGLIAEILPIARMQGVIAVHAEIRSRFNTFEDLLRDDVRVVQANPDAAAIGQLTRSVLGESGNWDRLDDATTAYRTTVTEAANDVLVGAADAAIVYDAVLHTYPDLEFVEIPELQAAASQVSVGVVQDDEATAGGSAFRPLRLGTGPRPEAIRRARVSSLAAVTSGAMFPS